MNSLVGLIESLAPTIYGPLYSKIYELTIFVLPGAFYLVGSGLKLIALVIFLGMYFSYRKSARKSADCVEGS